MKIKKNNRGRKLAERHWIPHEYFWCSKKEFFTIFEKAYGIGVSDGQKLKSHNSEYVEINGTDWICEKCGQTVDGRNVTFEEIHEGCGGKCH